MLRRLFLLVCFALLLAACRSALPATTPTAVTDGAITPTPAATAVPPAVTATATSQPSRLPDPTATRQATQKPTTTASSGTAVTVEPTTVGPQPTKSVHLTAALSYRNDNLTAIVLSQRLEISSTLRALSVEPAIDANWRIAWDDDRTVLSLEPDTHLPGGTTYTFTFLEALFAADGRLLSIPDPLTYTRPPAVTAVSPAPYSDWLYNYTTNPVTDIAITFAQAMDEASVINAFQIDPPVEGETAWEGNQLIFYPANGRLQGHQTYRVSIQPTARDATGNIVFAAPYTWSFTTGELHTTADFGVGYKVQVVDADGRRAVQYRSYETHPITVTFTLYDLNGEQAMALFHNYRYHNYRLGLGGMPSVATWTAVTDPQEIPENSGGYTYLNPQETFLPSDMPPGAYLLALEAGEYDDQLFLFLSHNTLAVKRADSQITTWVTDINGAARAGLEVTIWDDKGQEAAHGRTDGSGLFQTVLAPGVTPDFVLARDGDDLVITGFNHYWGHLYRRSAPAAYLAHITTDRPIYRPGHTVNFKAILRGNADAALTPLPEGATVPAYLRDARGNLVQTLTLSASHFGTVHGQFQLAEGAMTGVYRIEISLPDGHRASQRFKVEDYRKPDYEVSVTTDADRYLVGEAVSVTVDSAYFFGEPVANAHIQVYLFSHGGDWDDNWYTYDEPVIGRTDSNGRYTFDLNPTSGDYAIEATVDDGSHQSVSGFHHITVQSRAETLTLHTGNYLKEPGAAVNVQVEVKDIFGAPVANRAITLHLRHYLPDTRAFAYVDNFSGVTGADGRFTFPLTPAELGFYQLSATAVDRLDNTMTSARNFMVYNPANRGSRWYSRDDALTLSGSQEMYAPGETAQLFIQSTFAGPALLTLERATVHRQQLIELTPPLTVIDLPIESSDVPNIFANVMAWQPQETAVLGASSLRDSRLIFAEIELPISLAQKTLHIAVTPDKTQYRPGETAAVTLRVTNSLGDPVSAELSLAVVDEAIFSLSSELVGPMLDAFYFKRWNQVVTHNAMHPTRQLWYEVEPGGMGGGGGDGEGEAPLAGQPRRDFQDTAAWFPTLQTDANGEVVVTFTLPDNLTSWRLTAKAVTADTQVGESRHNITTWQPVSVRPILPRTLTAGDTLELSAIVHNYSETGQTLQVQLTIDNFPLTVDGSALQSITLAAGATRVVGWPVTAVAAGAVTLTVQVANDGGVLDAVVLPLSVQPLAVPDVTTAVGEFRDSFTTDISWPENALDVSTLQIDLNRSIAGSMMYGLEYLTGYPYGCVEQTMSRALPNAVVARAFRQLDIGNPALLVNLEPLVRASVQRLYGLQHADGGWGWWANDASHDYQTAWVLFGLTAVVEAGYEVDAVVMERGAAWLAQNLPAMDLRTRAFALYALALAGQGNRTVTLALSNQTAALDSFSRAALALALHELEETTAAHRLLDELAQTAVVGNGFVYWSGETNDGNYWQKTMASTTRNTALALSAFVQIQPGHELEVGITRYLMNQRRGQGWGSTNETAFTILALTDHLLAVQEVGGAAVTGYTVDLNGQTVLTGTLAPEALVARLELPNTALQPGRNTLTIAHEGLLYYTINSRVYQAQEEIGAAGEVSVTRVYLDALSGAPLTAVSPNQLVQVNITVAMPAGATYVIVEDNLPAGLEALNEKLDTTTLLASQSNRPSWESLGYNHKEIVGNRVSFFITDMAAGSHTFTYYARATHVGEFVALPAEVYAMYDLSVWGRSASRPLPVTP